ncbi:MAG: (2Fe-2S)-binding protein [Lachnospiraceae bacterium]
MKEVKVVCYCSNVTEEDIMQAILRGAKTLEDIRTMTGACTLAKCKEMSPRGTCCSPLILEILSKNVH